MVVLEEEVVVAAVVELLAEVGVAEAEEGVVEEVVGAGESWRLIHFWELLGACWSAIPSR